MLWTRVKYSKNIIIVNQPTINPFVSLLTVEFYKKIINNKINEWDVRVWNDLYALNAVSF